MGGMRFGQKRIADLGITTAFFKPKIRILTKGFQLGKNSSCHFGESRYQIKMTPSFFSEIISVDLRIGPGTPEDYKRFVREYPVFTCVRELNDALPSQWQSDQITDTAAAIAMASLTLMAEVKPIPGLVELLRGVTPEEFNGGINLLPKEFSKAAYIGFYEKCSALADLWQKYADLVDREGVNYGMAVLLECWITTITVLMIISQNRDRVANAQQKSWKRRAKHFFLNRKGKS